MCGRYTLTKPGDALAKLGVDPADLDEELLAPRFNVAPTQRMPVIVGREEVEAAAMVWGFPARGSERLLVNARSESVAEKPSFRDAFAERRCLVPADGFYEWRHSGRDRNAFHFHAPDHRTFFFAGLWQETPSEPGYVVITTPANGSVVDVHDRMPVILGVERGRTWLGETPQVELQKLLRPREDGVLARTAVGPRVNKVAHDDPSLLEPARHVENLTLF